MSPKSLKKVLGQNSFVISTRETCAAITEMGGQVAPAVFFRNTGAPYEPYRVFPWWNEKVNIKGAEVLTPLRGDFFCLPFGSNASPYRGEKYSVHGETSCKRWTFEGVRRCPQGTALYLSMKTTVRAGLIRKKIILLEGHDAIYCSHEVSGMTGRICFGHHACIAFPEEEGSGLVGLGPWTYGQVYPGVFADPLQKEYQSLRAASEFKDLRKVLRLDGGVADLTRYPARRGFEDLVMVCSEQKAAPGWSAVTFPKERNLWFGLKDSKVLASTILWLDNGGRYGAPWSGRSFNTLGIEEITGYFHDGIAASASPNPLKAKGIQTDVTLSKSKPLVVNYIMGAAKPPRGFGRVTDIRPRGKDLIRIKDEHKKEMTAKIRWEFLNTGKTGICELDE
ncbi:MAG: hypothetical protein NTX50_16070 [Candidatus Sumerlaeota bacterium]|nr:hypothetical protein [Candidatus Sumerlaeota bacterium]